MSVISSQAAVSVLEKPGRRRKKENFSFFLWLFNHSKIYLLISPFPFPTSQELLLTVIFLKTGGIPSPYLDRTNSVRANSPEEGIHQVVCKYFLTY